MLAVIRQVLLIAAVLAAVAFTPSTYAADALILVSQPRTARGEAAGLQLRKYFPQAEGAFSASIQLPGQTLRQPVQLVLDGRFGIAVVQRVIDMGSGAADGVLGEIALFSRDPLRRERWPRDSAWEPVQVLCAPDSTNGEQIVVIIERRRDTNAPEGRVRRVRLAASSTGEVRVNREAQWSTPGAPIAASANWTRNRLYLLSEGGSRSAGQLTAIDLEGELRQSTILSPLSGDALRPEPAGLAAATDGQRLCVLTSAYSLARGDGGRVSMVQWFDAESLEAIGGAEEIAGAADRNAPALAPRADGAMWAQTYDEATGFAYATVIALVDGAPVKQREEAFRVAAGAPQLAASPEGVRVALTGGRSLRILGNSPLDTVARNFDEPIEAILWGPTGLYVGEGAQIHEIDPHTAKSIRVSDAAGGFVVDLCVFESPIVNVSGESGQEGLFPARIELDMQTPGRDTRVIPISLADGEHVRLVRPGRRSDWLRTRLVEKERDTAELILALDKQILTGIGGAWSTEVELHIESGNAPERIAAIEVESVARRRSNRAIEWQSSQGSDPAYDTLKRILAGPPLHLSHRERREPFSRPPRGSAAAVVRLEDVARGAITRQVLLDYVSGGGGLLVIAGHTPQSGGEGVRRWLEPLGLLIESGEEVNGRFPVAKTKSVNFGMDQLSIAAGAYMEVTRPMDVFVQGPTPGTAVLALTRYGYGRLGVLASDTPLGDRALAQGTGQQFARALFGWLTGANATVRDSDLDGLRDDVEDTDASGAAERGETDWLRDDTDGDGVPDGAEDTNLNGIVDEGETNPRNADTDGDGIPDGADAEPLPRSGSPVLLAVQPPTAPAQGGTPLEIVGRNLPLNPEVWFGEQRATHVIQLDSTRIVAMPPPRAFGMAEGPMPVRVVHPLGGLENTLERAFTYGAPTPVRITLESLDRVRRAYDGYRGSFSLTLELGDVQIDYGAFYLRTTPPMMSLISTFERGRGLISVGREATFRSYGPGEFWVQLVPGEPLTGRVELGTLEWRLADLAPPVGKFQWYVFLPDLRVLWGGNASVSPSEQWTDLDAAVKDPDPPPGAPALP